jgi:hypothetical protein
MLGTLRERFSKHLRAFFARHVSSSCNGDNNPVDRELTSTPAICSVGIVTALWQSKGREWTKKSDHKARGGSGHFTAETRMSKAYCVHGNWGLWGNIESGFASHNWGCLDHDNLFVIFWSLLNVVFFLDRNLSAFCGLIFNTKGWEAKSEMRLQRRYMTKTNRRYPWWW